MDLQTIDIKAQLPTMDGHSQIQTRPLGVKTGQEPPVGEVFPRRTRRRFTSNVGDE